MDNLKEKIKKIIEKETEEGHFKVLDTDKSVELINQIIENYKKTNKINQNFDNLPKKGELIFVAAPTGAGKDTLVARLNYKNPEKKYIELNMDIFRHYFPNYIEDVKELTDKNFAQKTNEFAYEIYNTVQEILLEEFPGTNIIITGTLREINWVEDVFKKFKENKNTDYTVKLACLAVPKKVSAISVINRYIGVVNSQKNRLENYPGTARYTSMQYHDETFEKYPNNIEYFQKNFYEKNNSFIDCIEVYKRGKSVYDLNEDTKVFSTDDIKEEKKALDVIMQLRMGSYKISYEEIKVVIESIKNNSLYLKSQGTLKEISRDLAVILNYPKIVARLDGIAANFEDNNVK